ncbi:uncharacterized protein LOC103312367 isoform X1 [Tribolium castaneum]|uniref:uncharacterized protein LOC103312367 isoform X1 n=1 Tax=Tribolium castaneum TaxID=7070 RepID=UPI0001DCC926|nr:PREDICTED: uncharacterized protein LOC103312367 isoform X1 [Tribolium castaneum]|eukprot:XP_015833592.1 PREDICTED: uncharacterized protein LOC103312367 isoform X1 [Tribolium castaneum]
MLLKRSIFLQVCLLLTLKQTKCQDYESGYGVDESDDHSEAQEDSGPTDYSKYYAVDRSAPLISSAQGNIGFTSPIEYAGFFAPAIDFGASVKQEVQQPKNPFAAQTKSLGFISEQSQFPNFYAAGHFPVDYFEEAQKTQRQENQEDDGFEPSGGVDYISHNLPLNLDGEYTSEVEKVQPKPNKPKRKSKKVRKYDAEKEASEEFKNPDYSYEYEPSSSGKYTDYNSGKSSSTVSQQPTVAGFYEKLTEAPTATPYQKYSFQPTSPENKFLGSLISTVAPFNPSYSKIQSTAVTPTFETQPSENIPSHLKDKNCRRVRKHIGDGRRRKREAMNCYVCEDQANNSKYTQCSYAVEPEPTNDYSGISERYSTPAKQPDGFRYKRYSGDDNVDPYEYIKSRTQKAFTDAQETKDYEEYKIPDFYVDENPDKSYSEIQSEAIAKNPANCHKEESNGMTCTICKDPKTGGNFEQCSYTSEPKEQKYAYVTEKKYDSDEPEEGAESKTQPQKEEADKESKEEEEGEKKFDSSEESEKVKFDDKLDFKSSNDKPKFSSKIKEYKPLVLPSNDNSQFAKLDEFKPIGLSSNEDSKYSKLEDFKPSEEYKASYRGHDKFKLSDDYNPEIKDDPTSKKEPYNPPEGYQKGEQGGSGGPKKLIDDDPYDIPKHFAESTIKEQKTGVRGLEPSLYGSADSSEVEGDDADSSSDVEPYKDIDEYHFKLFPEFSNEESQQAEVVAANPSADATRKDVEEVLAEFSKKDRSACKKAEKNGMTCYLCVDKKGIQHEECMYVSESKPQASHVAYHEVKQIKSPNGETKELEQVPAATEIKRKHFFKKVVTTPTPFSMEAAASNEYETKIKYNPSKKRKSAKKVKEPVQAASDDDPEKLPEDDPEKLPEDENEPETPAEFVVGDEEGAYSAETKPVYSKVLGVKLPKYMIEKSEFEKEFDEFAGTH